MNPLILRYAPYDAVGLGLLGFIKYRDHMIAERAKIEVRLEATQDSLLGARHVGDSLASAFRVDTIRLVRSLTRRDTVLATVDRFLHDTVAVPVEVVRRVVEADSLALRACLVALGTCEQQTANLRTQLGLTEHERNLWKRKASPSWLSRTQQAVTFLGVGLLIGRYVK